MAGHTLTDLLSALERGDPQAYGQAFEVVYDELRAIAHAHRRHWSDGTLGTTALVHEAYLKLSSAAGLELEGRSHLLGVASRAMRQLLSNHARDQLRLKRGGALRRTSLDVDDVAADVAEDDLAMLVALDDALHSLGEEHERWARVVECRFFAGLSIPETAAALGTSPATVKRDWAEARDWLHRQLDGSGDGGDA